MFAQGVTLLDQGNPKAASRKFRQAAATASTESQRADALYNLAVCYVRLGNINAAVDTVKEAVDTDPSLANDFRTDKDFEPISSHTVFQEALQRGGGRSRLKGNVRMTANDIVHVEDAEMWRFYSCTEQTRIVLLRNSTPVGVAVIGELQVPMPLFRPYDQLAFVKMGPHHSSIQAGATLTTKDGIPLAGEITVEYCVRAADLHLKQVAADFATQYRAFADRVIASVQRVLVKHTYSDFDTFRARSGEEILKDFAERNSDNACSLEPLGVHTHKLDAADQTLREARLRGRQLEEQEATRARQAGWAAERAEQDARTKAIETKSQLELDRLRKVYEIEVEGKLQEQALALQAKKAELLRTEEGQMSEDMGAVLQHRARKLEVDKLVAQLNDKQSRDVLKAVLSHQSGQNSVLRALAANQIGIKLTDETAIAEGLKKLADGDDSTEPEPDETA